MKNNLAGYIRQSLSLALCALLMIMGATFVHASNPKIIDDVIIDGLKIHPEHEYLPGVLKVSLVAEKVADNQLVWKTLLYSTDHKDDQTDEAKFLDYRTNTSLVSLTVEHGMLIARDELGQYYAVEPKSGTLWKIQYTTSKIAFDIEMAKLFYQKKEYADAFEIWQNNRRTLEKQFGLDDLSLAYCDASMALVRYAEGLNAEGLLLYQKSMSLARKILLAGPKNHLLNQIRYSDFASPKVIELINEADSANEAKEYLKVIKNCKQVLDLDPYNYRARESLAIEYNNYGVSISDSSRALELFENSLFYWQIRLRPV